MPAKIQQVREQMRDTHAHGPTAFTADSGLDVQDLAVSADAEVASAAQEKELAFIKAEFPYLEGWPAHMLLKTAMGELAVINAQKAKSESRATTAALDRRVAANFRDLKAKPINVPAGVDDCISTLHSARFLPGPVCPVTKLWELAQRELPESGHRPLINYDIHALGLSAHVSTRGWAELHNPGSPHLTIKFFLASNLAMADRGLHTTSKDSEATSVEDKLSEPASLKELRKALAAADKAQRLVTPWNFSISALHGFMEATDFCSLYYHGRSDQAASLRQFIDSVFVQNASLYRASLPFLVSRDIGGLWSDWAQQFGLVPSLSGGTGVGNRGEGPGRKQQPPYSGQKGPSEDRKPGPPRNVCRRFDSPQGCPTTGPSCILESKGRKFPLQHLCTASVGPGIFCLMPHSQQQHKSS